MDAEKPSPLLAKCKKVSYFVEYQNEHGPSLISSGTLVQVVQPRKAPKLTIPVDPKAAATQRNIWAQFYNESGTAGPREKVDIVQDNKTTEWIDIERDD